MSVKSCEVIPLLEKVVAHMSPHTLAYLASTSQMLTILTKALLYNRHNPAKGIFHPLLLQSCQHLIDLQCCFSRRPWLSKLPFHTLQFEAFPSDNLPGHTWQAITAGFMPIKDETKMLPAVALLAVCRPPCSSASYSSHK